jgi:hypothetical protein
MPRRATGSHKKARIAAGFFVSGTWPTHQHFAGSDEYVPEAARTPVEVSDKVAHWVSLVSCVPIGAISNV